MILEQRGHKCVSILVLTDFTGGSEADDLVFPLGLADVPADATSIMRSGSAFVRAADGLTGLRLTLLSTANPLTIPTDRQSVVNQRSPFHNVRRRASSTNSLADQYEYVVLQKA
jgi:hypothetical protein